MTFGMFALAAMLAAPQREMTAEEAIASLVKNQFVFTGETDTMQKGRAGMLAERHEKAAGTK